MVEVIARFISHSITLIERYMDAAEASLLECMSSSSSSVAVKAAASARTKTAFEGAKDLVKKRKRRFRNVEFGADDYVTTIESKKAKALKDIGILVMLMGRLRRRSAQVLLQALKHLII